MSRRFVQAALGVVLAAMPISLLNASETVTVYSNFGPGMTADTSIGTWVGNTNWTPTAGSNQIAAQQFVPATTANFKAANLALREWVSGATHTAHIYLMSDASGSPGMILEQIDVPVTSPLTTSIVTATSALQPLLSAGTPYWLVAAATRTAGADNVQLLWYGNGVGEPHNTPVSKLCSLWAQSCTPNGPWLPPPTIVRTAFRIDGTTNSAAPQYSWTKLAPSGTAPSTRFHQSVVFDATTNQLIVFGGRAGSGPNLNDLWRLTGANGVGPSAWISQPTLGGPPNVRRGHSAVYDAANNRMIVFGGGMGGDSPCANDVWVLLNANGVGGTPTWNQLTPSGGAPAARFMHTAVYDPASNRMTVFGGGSCFSTYYNDVWTLSNANGLGGSPVWTQLSPLGGGPPPRSGATAVYDAVNNVMALYGGSDPVGNRSGDVWLLSRANGLGGTSSWSQAVVAGTGAGPRAVHSSVYDAVNNRMITFGGHNQTYLNDTWVLDRPTGIGGAPSWTQLGAFPVQPPPVTGHSAVLDAATGRMTVFAGSGPGYTLNDVWVLAPASDSTPPVITPQISGTPGSNGWYRSGVTVTWSLSDPESGIASSSGCGPVTLTSDTAGASFTCQAANGVGLSASSLVTIKIDQTLPTATGTATSATPASNGWFRSDVIVQFTGQDNLSGIAACTAYGPFTSETSVSGMIVNGTCTDAAGNQSQTAQTTFRLDKTAPALLATARPAPNTSGWNNTDVTVTFACSDALSGVASGLSSFSTVLTTEGTGQFVPGSCADLAGNTASVSVGPFKIDKTAPSISAVAASPNPGPLGTQVTLTAILLDSGGSGLASASYTSTNNSAGSGPLNLVTSSTVLSPPVGVHNVCVQAADVGGNVSQIATDSCLMVVTYDPEGGFVTGGGWINSPSGAYIPDPFLTGRATFGFVSKYKPGASVPTGETQFHFQAAKLDFRSTAYEWLVVAGARAQYKGTGTVNGTAGYHFMLTAIDGNVAGGGGLDRVRVRIWNDTGILYDNQAGSGDSADLDATRTGLGGGNIVIHKQ